MSKDIAYTTHDPACDRCRAKKVRCDRGSPRCETCERDAVQCRFSDRKLEFIQSNHSKVLATHEEFERRLGSIEDGIAEVLRSIKESETQTRLDTLQWVGRILDRLVATEVKTSNTSNIFSPAENSTSLSPAVYNDLLGQSPPYTTSLACTDDSQRTLNPVQDMEYNFAIKSKCLCQHRPQGSTSGGLIPSANTVPTVLTPWAWNGDNFDPAGLNNSAVFHGINFNAGQSE